MTSKNNSKNQFFRRILFLTLFLILAGGWQQAWATDYVIMRVDGNTTYYLGLDGTILTAKTSFDATCVWQAYNGGERSLSTNTRVHMMNVSNNTLFLNYSDNSISASTSDQRRWYGTDGTNIYYYNYPTTRYIHNTGSTVTVDNSSNNAFIPYSVTTTSVTESVSTTIEVTYPILSPASATIAYGQSQTFNASATATSTTITIPAHTTYEFNGRTIYYYNGTAYSSTDEFRQAAYAYPEVNYSWAMVSGAGTYLSPATGTGASFTTAYNQSIATTDTDFGLTVTASTTGASSKTTSATITIGAVNLPTSITPDESNLTLCAGSEMTVGYTLTPVNAYNNVTVISSNSSVATAVSDNNGHLTITAGTPGNATLTLNALDPSNSSLCSTTIGITVQSLANTPTISFNSTNNTITLGSTTTGATIYYTTNGRTPTTLNDVYTGPFTVSSTCTIKAIVAKEGVCDSEVAVYEIVKLETPYADCGADGHTVTFTSNDTGVTFYYTTGNYDQGNDPANPTTSSTAWNTGDPAITSMAVEDVVKVITYKASTSTVGYIASDVFARRVNTIDMGNQSFVFMYDDGTNVHFLANNNGNIANVTTFNAETCIWNGFVFANPTANATAAQFYNWDMKYEPFVIFSNNEYYLKVFPGQTADPYQVWADLLQLTPTAEQSLVYYEHTNVSGRGTLINTFYFCDDCWTNPWSFSLAYYTSDNKWERYLGNHLAMDILGTNFGFYNNPEYTVTYPVEARGGTTFALNVVYPPNYETTGKIRLEKGESLTVQASTSGSFLAPYYRVGNEVKYFFYYPDTNVPMTDEPEQNTDIRLTYELLGDVTRYLEMNGSTVTLVRDPGRDLMVTMRITATPWEDFDGNGVQEPVTDAAQTADYQFIIRTAPPFPAPVISRVTGTNSYQMECSADNAIIEYRIDDDEYVYTDPESTLHPGWYIYSDPISIIGSDIYIEARSFRRDWDALNNTYIQYMSDPVYYRVGGAVMLSPIIDFTTNGQTTLIKNPDNALMQGYNAETILYTIDGTDPNPEQYGPAYSTKVYNGPFYVENGITVKAISIGAPFSNSTISARTFKLHSGIDPGGYGIITLNDYEDHNWSYYQPSSELPDSYPDALHSPFPRNVKITYYGYGNNNLSTTEQASPGASTFNQNTTTGDVKVGVGEEGHTFIYYKTLERDANNRFPYELIPNPFYVRPDVRTYTGTRTLRFHLMDESGDGWGGTGGSQLMLDFSDGTTTQTITMASGSAQDVLVDVSTGVTVYMTWVPGGGTNDECSFSVYYNNDNTLLYESGLAIPAGDLPSIKVHGQETVTTYTGFYKWRVRSISGGSIYTTSNGTLATATSSTTSSDNVWLDAETTYYFAPDDALNGSNQPYNAQNATSMDIELEAIWAPAEVTTSTSFTKGYNSVERNFSVSRSGTSNNVFGSSTPCTYSSFYPNGTTNGTTIATLANRLTMGIGTVSANSKLEYYIISGNSSTLTLANHDVTIGRGVTPQTSYCAELVQGTADITSNYTGNLTYKLRMESGIFHYLTFVNGYYDESGGQHYNSNATRYAYTGTAHGIKCVLGSDYDRARSDNEKFNIAGPVIMGLVSRFTNTGNRTRKTLDVTIKSGKITSSIGTNMGTADAHEGIYLSVAGSHTNVGERSLTIEGGEMANIAGGIDGLNQATSTNYQGTPTAWANNGVRSLTVRMKGGTVEGAIYGGAAKSPASGDRCMVFTGGTVKGWLGAGCNGTEDDGGQTYGKSYVYVGGNTHVGGHSDNINGSEPGTVFGAGKGYAGGSGTSGEMSYGTNLAIADSCVIENNVYGGGNYGYALLTTNVYVLGGDAKKKVFGGSNLKDGPEVKMYMTGGLVEKGFYGGSNSQGTITGNIEMHINGGQVGTDVDHPANIHGGGYGADTKVTGNIDITLGRAADADTCVTIYGDVYGGSALGRVNGTEMNSSKHTNITMNKGFVYGSVYGGGLGDGTTEANVYGTVNVKMYGGSIHSTYHNGSGAVYGCNNVKGAPQTHVNVDIYGTDPATDGHIYALDAVYGGGNEAPYSYTPNVVIHRCGNRIGYVYGGGNATNVGGTDVTIYGCDTIGYVFGGGNGYGEGNPGANVNGDVSLKIYGGEIGQIYGGSNALGTISGDIEIIINKQGENEGSACDMRISEVYGGGNMAAGQAGTITIQCTGSKTDGEGIGNVYGGANKADIGTSSNPSDITLNIKGGIINRVFGGNNNSGNIFGKITVNVSWDNSLNCGDGNNYIGYVYGGGNQATYNYSGEYPEVNIINGTVTHDVYGGGYGDAYDQTKGVVTANTRVTVNQYATVLGGVYGGGQMANTVGNPIVSIEGGNVANVYGGGMSANIQGNTIVNVERGTVSEGVYGGCNASGTITGTVNVNIYGGMLGSSGTPMTSGVFGGGYGPYTTTDTDVTITIGNPTDETTLPTIYGDIYGGSALGNVNTSTSDETTINFYNGTLVGNLYGGGLGDEDYAAAVNGTVTVNVGHESNNQTYTDNCRIDLSQASVYGCNNVNGSPQGNVTVHIYRTGHTDGTNGSVNNTNTGNAFSVAAVFGGGNQSDYVPTVSGATSNVYVHGCDNTINYVYGGGNAAAVPEANVVIDGGHIGWVFAGGNGYSETNNHNNPNAANYNPGANVGRRTDGSIVGYENANGDAIAEIHGGILDHTFAGSNQYGIIKGTASVVINTLGSICDLVCNELFGGGNAADITGDLNTLIDCSNATAGAVVTNLYGGCNMANITGNVTLTVRGGTYYNIYGGSKGTSTVSADITGNVTLNIEGGTVVENIFGGNNVKGNIGGQITVNVEYNETDGCDLNTSTANVYGGGNLAQYGGTPDVNIKHGTVLNVFGGGNGDPTSSTQELGQVTGSNVTIGDDNPNHRAVVLGNVYGGGNAAKVTGNTSILLKQRAKVFGNVYGGGNMGKVEGNTDVIVNGVSGN